MDPVARMLHVPNVVVTLMRPDGKSVANGFPSEDMSMLASLWILHSRTTTFFSAANEKHINIQLYKIKEYNGRNY